MTENQTTTEVATRPTQPRVNVPLGRPLDNMDQAWRLAQALAAADIVGKELRGKPANAFLMMLYGQRLGLPPEIAINTIHVVEGKPRMSGQLLLAKVREAGHTPKVVHGKGKCAVTITRGDTGEEHTEEFTLDDAVTAGLCKVNENGKVIARSQTGKPLPWELHPKRMLMWRAAGFCVDVICPEVRMGFALEGELDDGSDDLPTPGQAVAERTDRQAPEPATETAQGTEAAQDDETAMLAELAEMDRHHTASDLGEPIDADLVEEQDGGLFEQPPGAEPERDRL